MKFNATRGEAKIRKIRSSLIYVIKLLKLYPPAKKVKLRMIRLSPTYLSHEREMSKFYSQFIKKGDLCFDVGANVGKFTKVFLKLGAKVICIEPQETCLQQLYKSFGDNKNVIIVGKAVGESEGYGELMICEDATTISTMSTKWKNESRFSKNYKWIKTQNKVPITTLDALILSHGLPKFCKIDVEGFEESVLKGLTKPIPFISFEFTTEFFDDAKKCINHLQSIGQVEFNCTLGESMKFLFSKWVAPDELYKKIAEVDNKLLWGDIYARLL
jgi:FkbM family methyltransferase